LESKILLHIESATNVCSVAVSKNGQLLAVKESNSRNSHSTVLTTFIDEVIHEAGVSLTSLDAIAVSAGPGSYTGLRIGVATAKGLCYSLDKPLISVPTLQAMAFGIWHLAFGIQHLAFSIGKGGKEVAPLICPMLDARRMEVYCAIFNKDFSELVETSAVIVEEASFAKLLQERFILFAGDGADKCKSLLATSSNAVFLDDFQVSAKFMIPFAEEKLLRGDIEEIAYYEPFYLKDFVAAKPRVKGLI
jgi:tRNA threonylcarbamoyladenosine biosynthesis protein TsaB